MISANAQVAISSASNADDDAKDPDARQRNSIVRAACQYGVGRFMRCKSNSTTDIAVFAHH